MPELAVRTPACICENCRTSKHSPGPVGPGEALTRFIFTDMHRTRAGKIKSAAFDHVETFGCSVIRETVSTDDEVKQFVAKFLGENDQQLWVGVLTARCSEVRKISTSGIRSRRICVYDTAESFNLGHAELCASVQCEDDGDKNEMRTLIQRAFKATEPAALILPSTYRGGRIANV